ncbi:MAG: ParB/RepB/Spo0J family partition protein [Ruminococcaceae bacterium]|nr:ParB/RepB/Spo0J family partition protein [Oscillospiraceae bacterium]
MTDGNNAKKLYSYSMRDELIVEIPIERIRANPLQPRKEFAKTSLYDLANSIKQHGVLQPITVRCMGEMIPTYELVSGERRLRAAKIAGLTTIPAIIYNISENDSAIFALVENLQRENLSFIEEAEGYLCLIMEYGLTQEEIARKVGKSQSAIANKIRLLKLPPMIKKIICSYGLSERHARALLKVQDEKLQLKIIKTVCDMRYSVQETEKYINEMLIKNAIDLENQAESQNNQKTVISEKKSKQSILKDIKLFVGKIRELITDVKKDGVEIKAAQFDRGEFFEFVVRIPKKENGLTK